MLSASAEQQSQTVAHVIPLLLFGSSSQVGRYRGLSRVPRAMLLLLLLLLLLSRFSRVQFCATPQTAAH